MELSFNKQAKTNSISHVSLTLKKSAKLLFWILTLSSKLLYAENTTTVNGVPISTQLYYEHYQHLLKTHPHAKGNPKLEKRLAKRATLPLVKEQVLRHEAQRLKLNLDTLEVHDPIKNLKQKYNTTAAFEGYLVQVGETENSLRLKHWINALTYQLMDKSGSLAVSAEEVKAEYQRQLPQLKQPEKLKAYQVLLKLPKEPSAEQVNQVFKRAQDLHKKLLEGDDFNILVQRYSEGALRSRNGDMGFVKRGDLIQNIEDELWRLKEGEFSTPLRTRYGWHIIKRGQSIKASKKSLEQVQDYLREGLRRAKYRKKRRTFIKQLWSKAKIDSPIALKY